MLWQTFSVYIYHACNQWQILAQGQTNQLPLGHKEIWFPSPVSVKNTHEISGRAGWEYVWLEITMDVCAKRSYVHQFKVAKTRLFLYLVQSSSVIKCESAIYTVCLWECINDNDRAFFYRFWFCINHGVLDIDYFTIFPVLTAFCASVRHCSWVRKLPSPSKAYACCLRPFLFFGAWPGSSQYEQLQ